MSYELLGQNRPAEFQGESLRNSQERGTSDGFDFVNKNWLSRCKTFEDGLEELERGRAKTEDLRVGLDKIEAITDSDGKFAMRIDGRDFVPTEHALNQMSTKMDAGTVYPRTLLFGDKPHPNDGAVLATIFNHQKEKLAKKIEESNRMESTFIVRTRTDGSMRAFLTAAYKPVDNRWLLELMAKLIPGGMLSHWKGDSDTIYGNILIPDSIRVEDDSDYGGLVGLGNCEIGTRRLLTQPGVFRHICWNGNLWDMEKGMSINCVHRGKGIDLESLAGRIAECIQKQIPLVSIHMDALLNTKRMSTTVNMLPILAQLGIDAKMSPGQSKAVLAGYDEEVATNEVAKGTLFGVINALTRASQTLSNKEWYDFDLFAGELVHLADKKWDSLTTRASHLSVEDINKQFAIAS